MVDVPVVQITPGRLLDTRIITVIRPRIDESVSKRIDTRHELCIALNLPDPTNRAMRLSFSLRVCAYMRARVCVARIKIHLIGPELVCYSHWGEKVTRGRLVARSANKRIGSAATSCFIIHRCKDWEWKTNREFLLIVARSSVKRRRDRYEASKKIIFLSTLSISTRDSSFTISYNLVFSYYTLVKIGGKQDLSVR